LSTVEADYGGGSSFTTSTSAASPVTELIEGTTTNPGTNRYCNTGSATSPGGGGTGMVYPSIIKVPDLGNTVANVEVELNGVSTSNGGLRGSFLLVSPGGTHNLDFFDDTFNDTAVSGLNLDILDTASSYPNGEATATSGSYKPTDNYVLNSAFPGTSPSANSIDNAIPDVLTTPTYAYPHGSINNSLESAFNTATTVGDWALYFFRQDNGVQTLGSGWCLDFTLNTGTATTTSVASNKNGANTAHVGDSVTITATVTDHNGAVNGGTVSFTENGVAVAGTSGAAVAVSGGTASITTTALTEGDHTIVANYSGDTNDNESSGQIVQRIDHVTTLSESLGVISACNTGVIASTLQPGSTTDGTTGPFGPNPSNIFAANLPGTLQSVSLSLNGLTTGDESIYLTEAMVAGPNGKGLDFFSGTGNSSFGPFGPINVTLSDSASTQIPQASYSSGAFKPADYDSSDAFSASLSGFYPLPLAALIGAAPSHGSSTFTGQFAGNDFVGNGTWNLFFNITAKLLQEKVANGWCLNFTQNPVAITTALAHNGEGQSGNFVQGELAAPITVNVKNDGVQPNSVGTAGDPAGGNANPLKVQDTLPTGLTYSSTANGAGRNGTNWTCTASGQVATCTNDAASVAVGASYPTLTIFADVSSSAAHTLSNPIVVSGAHTAGSSSSDSITVDPPPSLALTMSHTGTFTQSTALTPQTGEWDIQVSNVASSGSTFGTIQISDTLPTGYTLQGSSSTGGSFSCSGSGTSVSCSNMTSGATIAVGSPDTIHLTVVVPKTSAATVTDSACAFGGGDIVHTTCTPTTSGANSNVDTVNVIQVPASVAINPAIQTQSATILTAFAQPLVVTIEDAAGVAIKNYGVSNGAISFAAPTGTAIPTGTFAGGLSMVTPTADANGQVTETFTANNKVGQGSYSVTVTAGTSPDSVQNTFTLTNTVGAPASIGIVSGSGQSTAVTTAFGSSLVAQVLDAGSNPVPNAVVTFTAPAQTAASLTFTGGLNTATTDASGNATSAGITANIHAGGPYQVTASLNSLQTQFMLTNIPGPATQLIIPGGPEPFDTAFGFTITAEDAVGNVATSYNGTVAFTSPDPGFVNLGPVTLVNGTANPSAALKTAGTDSITATDTTNPAITGTGFFTIQPGVATHLGLSAPPSAYVGSPISYTLTAFDLFGNVATSYGGTVVFTSTDPNAVLPGSSVISNGTGTFSATMGTAGTQTITATDAANSLSAATGDISVTIPNYVVTTAADDVGTASNCTIQTTPGTGTDGSCSLRDALLAAAGLGSGNITFDSTAFASATSITLASTLTVPSNTTIQGPTSGSGATLQNLVTVDGGGAGVAASVFTTNDNAVGAVLQNLIITDGFGSPGGGIFNGYQAALTLQNCTVSANSSATGTGGIFNNYNATLVVLGSTITGNSGVVGGISSETGGSITITNSTLAGNGSTSSGGAINNGGTSITIADSTISGNSAQFVGGGINTPSGTTTLANTIVAGNSAGTSNPDINGSDTDNGGNQIGTAVSLSPLGSYGGPTQTMLPLPASAAICGGLQASIASGVTTDQRAFPNTNATYPGCSAGAPCVDAGAVQTNYAISFTTDPPATVDPDVAISPAPVVTLTESGVTATPASGPLPITDSSSLLTGTTSTNFSGGVATFSNLMISSGSASDSLTATLALNGSLNLIATSATFSTRNLPALSLAATDTGLFVQGQTAEWDVTVGNAASSGPTTGTLNLVDTLPANYTLSSYASTGSVWACTSIANVVTCSSAASIATGATSTINLIVNVPANSATSVTNSAVAWGGGDPLHSSQVTGAAASDPNVAVQQVPASLSIANTSLSAPVGAAYSSLALTVVDAGGVAIPNYAGPVVFTATTGTGGATGTFAGPSSTASVGTDAGGIADPGTFTANTTAGNFTVGVSLGGLSATFNMTNTATAFSQLVVSAPPNAFAGWPIDVTVTPEDQFGNPVSISSDTLHVTSSDGAAVLPADSTLCGCGGILVTLNTVGLQTVTVTDTANSIAGTSGNIFVVAPPTLVVTTNQDDAADETKCSPQTTPGTGTDSACSLRDALNYSSSFGAASISFDSTAFSSANTTAQNTITLTNGVLEIPNDTSIAGSYPTGALITVSGNNASGVFQMTDPNAQGSIAGLAITGGLVNDAISTNPSVGGAGIYNDGVLTVTNSIISGNNASSAEFAIGGGIYSDNDLEISNSTVSGNTVTTPANGDSWGGGILDDSYVNAVNVTISGNSAIVGSGGIAAGGGILTGAADILNSTISGNTAQGPADGSTAAFGGGIAELGGPTDLLETTVSGNTASAAPNGIGGGIYTIDTFALFNTTVSANTADDGGGMYVDGAAVFMANTILAGNSASKWPNLHNSAGLVDNLGGNLMAATVKLAPLGNYGGPTATMLPLPGSLFWIDGFHLSHHHHRSARSAQHQHQLSGLLGWNAMRRCGCGTDQLRHGLYPATVNVIHHQHGGCADSHHTGARGKRDGERNGRQQRSRHSV
jgi:hypothetical protein